MDNPTGNEYAGTTDDNTQSSATASTYSHNNTSSESAGIDLSSINEAQLLLACRSWLIRKHKLEWKEKKRRADAAASPLNNEGYFWPDPNDLLYLREDPDPYNLNYNETYGEYYGYKRNGVRFLTSQDTTYSGKNYLEDETISQVEERASTSSSPFSTNPLYPSAEHVRRSNAKIKLWRNETWKKEWYSKRWEGRVATDAQKLQDKQDKLVRGVSNDVIESSSFDNMSDEDVTSAIISYLVGNQRKSTSRLSNKDKRQIERESFREWREQVKREARNAPKNLNNITKTMKEIASVVTPPPSSKHELSFTPSVKTMRKLKKQRSEKSRRAFQTRLANSKAKTTSISKNITKFYAIDDGDNINISPMKAILHVDNALDQNKLPSPIDVETMLKPGRLGRRRDILRRILSDCFGLRGKCVPSLSGEGDILFVTQATINELGSFVLTKLREQEP